MGRARPPGWGRGGRGVTGFVGLPVELSSKMFTSCGLLWFTGPQPSPESVNDRDAEKDLTHGGATEGLQSGSRFLQWRGCTGNGVW